MSDDTYRYLRMAIVGVLVGLGVAVTYQTARQGFHPLASVSAYYYTPAQAIFVGALVGLGLCMIALRGTTEVEDIFLKVGGMFAIVAGVVPTSRGEDYDTAVRACEQAAGPLLTQKASNGLDCPTVRALAEATKANVENNMTALLVVGFLALLSALLFFLLKDSRSGYREAGDRTRFWWGFGAASFVFAVALVTFWVSIDQFVSNGHDVAAWSLFACVFVVAAENARRHQDERSDGAPNGHKPNPVGVLISYRHHGYYAWIARAMVAAVVIGVSLFILKIITLFWIEMVVALLFALFWLAQTIEQSPGRASAGDTSEQARSATLPR
jgi:hypothetical protein